MSSETGRIGEVARSTAVETAWAQWSALVALAAAPERQVVSSIVDAEALVLLSLSVRERERRLNDVVMAFARTSSSLLGVHRMRTLARRAAALVRAAHSAFARAAADGGDRRWRAPAAANEQDPPVRLKPLGELRLLDAPALQLRLRAGMGVGARADLLALLLGLGGEPVSIRVASDALGYSSRAMRTAAEEMVQAGFVGRIYGSSPAAFRADGGAWAGLLFPHDDPADLPRWRFWAGVFAFLAGVGAWEEEARAAGWSDYVAASRARDVAEGHARGLALARIALPDPRAARGAEYLAAFGDLVERVGDFCRESL